VREPRFKCGLGNRDGQTLPGRSLGNLSVQLFRQGSHERRSKSGRCNRLVGFTPADTVVRHGKVPIRLCHLEGHSNPCRRTGHRECIFDRVDDQLCDDQADAYCVARREHARVSTNSDVDELQRVHHGRCKAGTEFCEVRADLNLLDTIRGMQVALYRGH